MKTILIAIFILIEGFTTAQDFVLPGTSIVYPFPGPPSSSNTTAISKDSPLVTGWADGYTQISYGTGVDDVWKTPQKALGKATSDTYDIVCLGNGGRITMTFSKAIADGPGFDFAVFENGNTDTFLELAWVEVSSDGTHFSRFPNFYATNIVIGTYAGHDTTMIYGLASKYKQAYGTPFDLHELTETYNTAMSGSNSVYTAEYKSALTNNFPYLDTNNVRYVRIIDIIGDGSAKESSGRSIYDPTPTFGSGGFDLEAIGVINQAVDSRTSQMLTFNSILNQKLSTGSLTLNATASSSLPVSYTLLEGNATISSNRLTFTGTGQIVIQAQQIGNATYAPAVPVTQSFYVGQKIQHIYVEPIPNQIPGTNTWQLRASADSGLPVSMEVLSGPSNTVINSNNLIMTIGNQTFGSVELRAWQGGNSDYAPADDVRIIFSIVPAGAANAPKTFAQWSTNRNLAVNAQLDSDGDGAKNFQEYIMGTSPTNSIDIPRFNLRKAVNAYGEPAFQLNFRVNRQAYGRAVLQKTETLTGTWSNVVPQLVSSQSVTNSGQVAQELNIQVPADLSKNFYRLLFQEP
jgi:hypothetical protein